MSSRIKVFLATEVRIYKVGEHFYADVSFAKILERYSSNFGKLFLATRIIVENEKRKGYVMIDDFCCKFDNIGSIAGFLSKRIPEEIVKDLKGADLVIMRLPSVISLKMYNLIFRYSKKYLVEVMGCAWDGYWNHGVVGKMIALPMFLKIRSIIKNADYCIYVTQQFLQKRYPCGQEAKSIGISNVDISLVAASKLYKKFDVKNFTIMTAAALNVRYKGQEYVIKAISDLKKKYNINATYYLAGKGDADYLTEVAKKYGVEKQVVILGMLPKDELVKWMRKVDFYIQPSLQEGLPRSLIEAMSQGTICLGTRTAGIPELLREDELFRRKDGGDIVRHILGIMSGIPTMSERSRHNLIVAERYLNENLEFERKRFLKMVKTEVMKKYE